MTIGSAPSYLSKNKYSYYFKMKIPIPLHIVISKKERRYSLKTGDLTEAKTKAPYVAAKVQLLFRDVENWYFADMNLTKEQVQLMLKRHLQRLIKEYDKPAVPN